MLHLLAAPEAGPDWWELLRSGGAIGILAAVVTGFVRGWIVPGPVYKEACQQRDRATDQVYKLADTAQRAIEVAERKVG